MNILGMGTAASYVKGMALNMKWQERKQNPLLPKEDDPQIAELKRQAEQQRRSNKIGSLYSKMLSGSYLTQDELAYLREHSPENYEKAVQIEREREEYKRELEQCRSKEDVEKLHQRRLSQFCGEAGSSSNIPAEKKKEQLEMIGMRMKAVTNEYTDFKNTPEYQRLPQKTEEDKRGDHPGVIYNVQGKRGADLTVCGAAKVTMEV